MYKKLVFLMLAVCTTIYSSDSGVSQNKECYYGLLKIVGDINLEQAEKSIKRILAFSDDNNIKGVLIVINSPGGQSGTSELIFREIQMLAHIKPVVALVVNNGCSGAYKIAMASHWIVATAAASVGGIGSYRIVEKHKNARVTKSEYSADVEYEIFAGGKFKTIAFPESAALTPEQRDYLQADIDDTYRLFYTMVAQQRNMSLEKLSDWADGKIFTGEKALEKGLIDQVGGYSDAVKKLAELIQKDGTSFWIGQKLTYVE